MAKLGDICTFQSGGTPSKSNAEYFNGSIPWITTVALTGDYIDKNDAVDWITDKAIQESAAKIVPENSIMVGTRVGIGKVAINAVPMSTSQDIVSLINIDDTKWDKKFLCKVILARNNVLLSQARGATIKGIKIDTLAKLEIPEIPLNEQRRISAVMDKVSGLIAKRREQLDRLDELVKARFVEMFGDCKTNPKGWKTCYLEDIAEVGSSKRVFVEELKDEGIPFYRGTEVGALAEGMVITPELFITEEHYKDLCEMTGKPQKGDLLMPSICPDGRIWLVDTDAPFYFKDGRVLWVHGISDKFDPVFLLYTLKDRITTDYSSIASGTTFAELKIFALKKCQVFNAPVELQKKFSAFISVTNKSKLTIQQSLDKLEVLKKALMQGYFKQKGF